ncbi:ribosome small subunit-dependent GTPase A [Paenisporosarcina cavernae]|uniref:Small ribosomal subunit biogenesis GTPase RsgA n=1 Tax=Paenisporosarcina cavernae TaxID=2320858 RepID=A0A385YR49_9BACL|nr:ribosome small subunit-dependent GTPase A [Paenisporosarcina cavernae]AYC29199.1 ribosome small subunit-dependent GTPase A [Paenisporosarcina cavernae]
MPTGQIRKAISGFYYVHDGDTLQECRGRGVFRNRGITPLVGDFVEFEKDTDSHGTITHVLERTNALVRPPVANIDQALLVFSLTEPDFHPLLLDRFLVAVESFHVNPIICLTKTDIASESARENVQSYLEDYRRIGYQIVETYKDDASLVANLAPILKDKISVLAGQSGVGKSTMLNTLLPSLELKTAEISEALGRGKHTTRHVELLEIGGGLLADTPGFSSFDFDEMEKEELSSCFPEMRERAEHCKFRGCLHLKEPKCAIKAAVDSGEIPSYRYDHYLQFLEEIMDRKPRY